MELNTNSGIDTLGSTFTTLQIAIVIIVVAIVVISIIGVYNVTSFMQNFEDGTISAVRWRLSVESKVNAISNNFIVTLILHVFLSILITYLFSKAFGFYAGVIFGCLSLFIHIYGFIVYYNTTRIGSEVIGDNGNVVVLPAFMFKTIKYYFAFVLVHCLWSALLNGYIYFKRYKNRKQNTAFLDQHSGVLKTIS